MKSSPVCRTIQTNGKQHYLWRAVDQDGEVVDVFLQTRRDGAAAKRFFNRLLRSHGGETRKIVTDKLRSYGVAHRELMPDVSHDGSQYANNRAEQIGSSNQQGRLSGFWVPTLLYKTYSTLEDTWSGLSIIETSG